VFITNRSLPRRTVLRGLGSVIALPFLESMLPARANAQTAAPPLRFGAVYVPNGIPMAHAEPQWIQAGPAGPLELMPILKPLEPFQDKLTVVGNISRAGRDGVTDHAVSTAGWLSGAVARQTEAEDIRAGVTLDQILAKRIGQQTPLPSLEYATEDFAGYIGGCVPGYSCVYMNTISWASETEPLPMEINPRVAFERLFGRAGSAEDRLRRMHEDRSILDSIADEARSLQRSVSPVDRSRLESYLDNLREIERRIQRVEAGNSSDVATIDAPVGIPQDFEAHIEVMFELLAIALQADLTRVFTFMTGREASQRTYPGLGMTFTHHDTSHHGRDPEKMSKHAQINTYFTTFYAKFLETLANSPEGDGSVLDHSLVAYGTGMSDGQAHDSYPLPIALAGGLSGRMKGGRFLVAPEWTTIGNLWIDVASRYGVPLTSLGESDGRFEV
jgi:hypothetical protein